MPNIHDELKDQPNGVYVRYTRLTPVDEGNSTAPDANDEGFWPSLNAEDAGYIGENPATPYETQLAQAKARMDGWLDGEWYWIGVKARARMYHKQAGCITEYSIESAGIWGVESDAPDAYLLELFDDQCAELDNLLCDITGAGITLLHRGA